MMYAVYTQLTFSGEFYCGLFAVSAFDAVGWAAGKKNL